MEILRRTLKVYVLALCAFAALSLILAAVIRFTGFPETWTFAGLVAALSLVSLLTGAMEGGIIGKRGMIVGAAAAAILVLIILLLVGGVFAGSFGMGSFSAFYIIPVVFGSLGGAFGVNLSK